MEKLINQAYKVAQVLKDSKEYQDLCRLDNLIENKYKNEIEVYKQTFKVFDEALKIGKDYYPNFSEVAHKHQLAKTNLYEKKEVKKYFELEKLVNNKLDDITKALVNSVSNYSNIKGAFCQWK